VLDFMPVPSFGCAEGYITAAGALTTLVIRCPAFLDRESEEGKAALAEMEAEDGGTPADDGNEHDDEPFTDPLDKSLDEMGETDLAEARATILENTANDPNLTPTAYIKPDPKPGA
jgi:hypothetical protein